MLNNKTQIYLISPPKIDNLQDFSTNLEKALLTKKIPVFQLRLKQTPKEDIIRIATHLIKICHKYQTLFILNDDYKLALEIGTDGVHIGFNDGDISQIRKESSNHFIIGVSCYDSKDNIMIAAEEGANYLSLGAFFPSKTKKSTGKPNLEILKWCSDYINLPIVAIGGITNKNCQTLTKNGADFLAVISYIWDHEKGVDFAVESLFNNIFQ